MKKMKRFRKTVNKAVALLAAGAVSLSSAAVLPDFSGNVFSSGKGTQVSHVSAAVTDSSVSPGRGADGSSSAAPQTASPVPTATAPAITDPKTAAETALDKFSRHNYYKFKISGLGNLLNEFTNDKSVTRRISGSYTTLSLNKDGTYYGVEMSGKSYWVDINKRKSYEKKKNKIYMEPVSKKDVKELKSEITGENSTASNYANMFDAGNKRASFKFGNDTSVTDPEGVSRDCLTVSTGNIDMSSMFQTTGSSEVDQLITSLYNGLSMTMSYTYYIDKSDYEIRGFDTDISFGYAGQTQTSSINTVISYPDSIELDPALAAKALLNKGYITKRAGIRYKVVYSKGKPVLQVNRIFRKKASVRIPSYIKIAGKNYKISSFSSAALRGNRRVKRITGGRFIKNKKPLKNAVRRNRRRR